MSPSKVSVIIPAFNCEKTIAAAVKSCLAQRHADVELIVVDDGSTDSTGDILKSINGIRLIGQENKGPARARNAGAKAASGEFLAFTDSDCIAHGDWLEKLLTGFREEATGAVAGSYGITNAGNMLARCIQSEIVCRHDQFKSNDIKALGSYNFIIRKSVFDRLGGFDETYRRASGEDNDLSYRIIKAGYRIAFVKEALVDHTHPESVRKYLREQFRHGFWRAKLYLDHPRMARGDDYTIWKDALETFACGLFFLSAVGAFFMPGILAAMIVSAFLFYFFELIFCFSIRLPVTASFFYAFVMLLRSLARTLGLATGIGRFIFVSRTKKAK